MGSVLCARKMVPSLLCPLGGGEKWSEAVWGKCFAQSPAPTSNASPFFPGIVVNPFAIPGKTVVPGSEGVGWHFIFPLSNSFAASLALEWCEKLVRSV